jgi:adenylate kinase family enzyme
MTQEPRFIVLLGPPASGKGTQAAQLREALNLPHIASGDLFRENLKNETELVPDDVTIAMVMERLSRPDCANGALLDGFPLIGYYRRQGVLVDINGDQSIEEIQTELRAAVAQV